MHRKQFGQVVWSTEIFDNILMLCQILCCQQCCVAVSDVLLK